MTEPTPTPPEQPQEQPQGESQTQAPEQPQSSPPDQPQDKPEDKPRRVVTIPPHAGKTGTPPNPGPPGPRGDRPFPKGERPKTDGTKPPALNARDFGDGKPNRRSLDQSIEDELNAAMAGFDVSKTVIRPDQAGPRPPRTPGKKSGTVVGVHGKDVFVDVPGGRSQGVLPIQQFDGKIPAIGDPVEFDIEGYDPADGLLVLTMEGAVQQVTDWSSVAPGMVVEAKVTGVNKNKTGLSIEVNGIRGFMPASQVDLYRTENIEALINQKLKCVVTEVDPADRNLLVSRRTLLEREREQQREQFWAAIEEGQRREGIVRSVKPFGAFVDLGGADGMIPVSEMSWNRVGDPSEVVQIGQKVEVVVTRLDPDARKIGLSLRALIRSPWADFAEANKTGTRLVGTVTRLMDFGAFVEVAPGIEGLVHISELSTQRVGRVRDIVQEGQAIEVELLGIDIDARRMSLSLKSLKAEAESAEAAKTAEEEEADKKEAADRMVQRKANPNLRGGIGSGKPLFEMPGE